MRKGLLFAMLGWLATAGIAAAQMPYPHYARYPVPPAPSGYYYPPQQMHAPVWPHTGYQNSPRLMVGAPLSANGPVQLPSMRGGQPFNAATAYQAMRAAPTHTNFSAPAPQAPAQQAAKQPTLIQRTTSMFSSQQPASTGAVSEYSLNQLQLPSDVPTQTNVPNDQGNAVLPPAESYSVPDSPAPPVTVPHATEGMVVPEEVIEEGVHCEPGQCRPSRDPVPPPRYPRGYRFYGEAEYLFYWLEKQNTPPLLFVGPLANPTAIIGNGGAPGVDDTRHGGRATIGYWLNRTNTWGLEASGFWFPENASPENFQSQPGAQLSRPFLNPLNNALMSIPVDSAGIESEHRLWGAEVNLRKELIRSCWGHIDLLAGIRYFNMEEDLRITDSTNFAGMTISRLDEFATENQFYGGQTGVEAEFRCGRWSLNTWGKVALGVSIQELEVKGGSAITGGAAPVNVPFGLLAQASNSGEFDRSELSVLPEVGVKLGYRITDNLRIAGGYNFFYVTNVARPGDQIDIVVSPPGGPRPAARFVDDDFWMHGVSAELEFRY